MLLVALIGLASALPVCANTVTIIQGGNTNVFTVVGTTTNVTGVLPGVTTNAYNLGYGIGGQSNTNLFPQAGDPLVGYPGTLAGPSRVVTIQAGGALMAGSGTTPISFSLSNDGSTWVTNAFTFYYSPGTPALTNLDTYGANYICVNQIINTNAAALTNLVLSIGEKPSL